MIENYKKMLEEALEEIIPDTDHDTTTDHLKVYSDEDPYEVIERNDRNKYYQVLGNEIITITRGKGFCCLCSLLTDVLYADNTYNNNIPVQICKKCIGSIME